jgi:hypothetical protein
VHEDSVRLVDEAEMRTKQNAKDAVEMARNLYALGIGVLATFMTLFLCLATLGADRAEAAGINKFTAKVSVSQAGGHPDVDISVGFDIRGEENGVEVPFPPGSCACSDPRILKFDFPTGFIGNPHAVTRCSLDVFSLGKCAPSAQVGVLEYAIFTVPIFNLEPHRNEPGLIGFNLPFLEGPTFIVLQARTGSDYGLSSVSTPIFHYSPLKELNFYLWGVPAATEHDANRFPPEETQCILIGGAYPDSCFPPVPANIPAEPFLQNPTKCDVPLSLGLEVDYYDGPRFHAEHPWPTPTGCDLLGFNPSLSALPTTRQADTPSGLDIGLKVPQIQSPTVPTPSQLKALKLTLPEGFTFNPGAPDGKRACTDAEARLTTEEAAQCPEHAKIGSLRLDSSALPGPIDGAIYLGAPKPDDPYPVILAASGFATNVKLRGSAYPDPQTGQIVIEFPELPQSPFSEFDMHVFGSERGLFATPSHCGTYPVRTEFVPWNSSLENQHSTSFFVIDSGPGGAPCPQGTRPLSPRVQAGSEDNTAGIHTPFTLHFDRADGNQLYSRIDVTNPLGFSASIRGVPYCSEAALAALAVNGNPGKAEIATPSCPQASQVGTAVTSQGSGTHPVYTPGKIYLAGPYKGAPLSLAIVIPALVGPYDLGTVLTRVAIHVDPITAQLRAVSDPIIPILEGIPLRVRSILFDLDRPEFTLNPTNCSPFSVDAAIFGLEGGLAKPSAHFQVANCAVKPFAPRLALRMTGSTKRAGNPALKATVRANPGDANIARTQVTLPKGQLVDNAHVANPCTRVQFAANACPESSIIGYARAKTPLLDQALEGPVYLRSSSNKIPDLVADLKGQIEIELAGSIDSIKQRIRTTFETVPDVPVTSFILNLKGGRSGLIENGPNLCGRARLAAVRMTGQNGVLVDTDTRVQMPCGQRASQRKRQQKADR